MNSFDADGFVTLIILFLIVGGINFSITESQKRQIREQLKTKDAKDISIKYLFWTGNYDVRYSDLEGMQHAKKCVVRMMRSDTSIYWLDEDLS